MLVLDTVGFGDPTFNQSDILKDIRKALQEAKNTVDCIVYVVNKGRFTDETVKFFKVIQRKILKIDCRYNSVLVVTHCNDPEWIIKNRHMKFSEQANGIDNAHAFNLKFAYPDLDDSDDPEEENKCEQYRQKYIDKLVEFLNDRNLNQRLNLNNFVTRDYM